MSFLTKIFARVKGNKNWEEHEVDTQPLTLVCHKGDMDIRPSDEFFPINPETTKYHGFRVDRIDPDAKLWIEFILGYPLVDKEDRGDSDAHIIGLCDLTIKFIKQGMTQFFVKEPETHLHPAQQTRVADFFVMIANLNDHQNISTNISPPPVGHWSTR